MDTLQPQHSRLNVHATTVAFAFVFGTAALAPSTAQACRCPTEPTIPHAYRQAWAVVYASVQHVDGDPYGASGSSARLKPIAAWKRDLPSTLTVHTSSTCAFEMHQGEQVLLFLQHTSDGERVGFSTRQCFGNRRDAEAQTASDHLNRIGKRSQLLP